MLLNINSYIKAVWDIATYAHSKIHLLRPDTLLQTKGSMSEDVLFEHKKKTKQKNRQS